MAQLTACSRLVVPQGEFWHDAYKRERKKGDKISPTLHAREVFDKTAWALRAHARKSGTPLDLPQDTELATAHKHMRDMRFNSTQLISCSSRCCHRRHEGPSGT